MKSKRNLYFLFAFVLIFVSAIGLTLFLSLKVNDNTVPSYDMTLSPDEIRNWTTYENDEIGISLKHPPYDSHKPQVKYNAPQSGVNQFVVSAEKNFDTSKIAVCNTYQERICLIPGKNWDQGLDIQVVRLSTKSAVSFYLSVLNAEKSGSSVLHVVQLTDSPFLELSYTVDGSGNEALFQKILSTVSFSK